MRKDFKKILIEYANDTDFEEFENHKEYYDNSFWYFHDEDILIFECIYKGFAEDHFGGAFKLSFDLVNQSRYHLYKEDEREEAKRIENIVKNELEGYDEYVLFELTPELKNLGYISLVYDIFHSSKSTF